MAIIWLSASQPAGRNNGNMDQWVVGWYRGGVSMLEFHASRQISVSRFFRTVGFRISVLNFKFSVA